MRDAPVIREITLFLEVLIFWIEEQETVPQNLPNKNVLENGCLGIQNFFVGRRYDSKRFQD